jgi:hypothetical protein
MAEHPLDHSTQDFLNALRNSSLLSEFLFSQKNSFQVYQNEYGQNMSATEASFKQGDGLYGIVSKIWKRLFPDPRFEFNDEHELALREYILVEKFGWEIDDATYWIMEKNTTTRKGPTKFQKDYIPLGSRITQLIKKLRRDHINKHIISNHKKVSN